MTIDQVKKAIQESKTPRERQDLEKVLLMKLERVARGGEEEVMVRLPKGEVIGENPYDSQHYEK